jgi:molecular chaperone GrpE
MHTVGRGNARAALPEGPSARIARLEAQLRHALAELDVLRAGARVGVHTARADERAHSAAVWLPVLDNLDRAVLHARSDPHAHVADLEALRYQALGVLAALGFPRRFDEGEPFDPTRHHAVATVPSGDLLPAGTVVYVVRPSYGLGDRQLRPAEVVVAADL